MAKSAPSLSALESAAKASSSKATTRNSYSAQRYFRYAITSNIAFCIASILYVWLAVVSLEYEQKVKDIPDEVWTADDDVTWAEYDWTDDYVLQGITARDVWVSRAQILYFCAALGFVLTGLLDLLYKPALYGVVMLSAGLTGLVSACLVVNYYRWALIFSCVSVHLFALDALQVLYWRETFPGIGILFRIGDLAYMAGTFIDVALSYVYLLRIEDGRYGIGLANLAVFAACMWLLTSIIYVVTTMYVHHHDGYEEDSDDEEMGTCIKPKHELVQRASSVTCQDESLECEPQKKY